MIDRIARDQLATAVRQFANGTITNRQFESVIPASKDKGVAAIEDYVWRFYDDFLVHRMSGKRALSLGLRRDFARAVLFLKSNEEYEWPPSVSSFAEVFARWISAATAGFWHPPIKEPHQPGDRRVWPFLTGEGYSRALKCRCYLRGKVANQLLRATDQAKSGGGEAGGER